MWTNRSVKERRERVDSCAKPSHSVEIRLFGCQCAAIVLSLCYPCVAIALPLWYHCGAIVLALVSLCCHCVTIAQHTVRERARAFGLKKYSYSSTSKRNSGTWNISINSDAHAQN